jgi:hypothetical protein
MPTPIDRPITISGGSPLTIQQQGARLRLVNHRTLVPDHPDSTVTSVDVASDGRLVRSVRLGHRQCGVSFHFGHIELALQTDPQGRNLRIVALGDTRFATSFRPEAGGFASISRGPELAFRNLKIHLGGVAHRVRPALGHTEIVIHYVERGEARRAAAAGRPR